MNEHKKRSTKNKSPKINLAKIITVLAGIMIPLVMLYIYIAYYYQSHFFKDTVINGVRTENMTVAEAEELINTEVKAYSLTLEGRNEVTDSITGQSINLHTVFERGIADLMKDQKNYAWPLSFFQPHELQINTMLEYDEELLRKEFPELAFFAKENNIMPENAKISEYGEGGYTIIPETQGAKVIENKLYQAVSDAINTLSPSISLEELECYEKPEITSEYPDMVKALEELNKIAGAQITYQFGADIEVLDGSKISKWLSVDNDYQVTFQEAGVKEFVDYIGKTYNSFGRVRKFNTSYGKTVKVEGGDYGWWLNRGQETKELIPLIKNGEKVTREPVYYQTAQQYGKDDIGDTYVEVNLSAQHLFFYVDGKMVLESDFVSGNVSKNLATPTGTYPVQYKENDATLVGEDYETPVKYWMPFNKNIGFHDATWRSAFGKDIFITNGSHGCINMPPAAAKKMFKYIKRGFAVVVYELPGTENYDVEKYEKLMKALEKAKEENQTTTDSKAATEDTDNTVKPSSEH